MNHNLKCAMLTFVIFTQALCVFCMERPELKSGPKPKPTAHTALRVNPAANAALFEAIASNDELGNLKEVRESLRSGASVNVVNKDGYTALQYAVFLCQDSIVKELLLHGPDLTLRFLMSAPSNPRSGSTLLHLVAEGYRSGSLEVLKQLLKKNLNINDLGPKNRTPLHIAASCGQHHLIKELLSRGAHVGVQDANGQTPYQLAEEGTSRASLELLREAEERLKAPLKLQPLVKPVAKKTAAAIVDLNSAVQSGNIDVVRGLLNARHSPDDAISGTPLLMLAALHSQKNIALTLVEILLARGATPVLQDLARLSDRQEIASIIVDRARQFGVTVVEPQWLVDWRQAQKP